MDKNEIHLIAAADLRAHRVGSLRVTCGAYVYPVTDEFLTSDLEDVTCVHCANAA